MTDAAASLDCEVCGAPSADNCYCDDPNFVDDRWLEDEEARERLREEDLMLYTVPLRADRIEP